MIPKTTRDLEPQLKQMLFRKYSVNGIIYNILDYKISDLKVEIVTDIKTFNVLHIKLQYMLDIFIEVADSLVPKMEEEPEADQDPAVEGDYEVVVPIVNEKPKIEALSATAELKNILMDNIRKLSKDRTYIHQSAAINDTVKTIIEVAKTEIQAQELVIKMHKAVGKTETKALS